MIIVWRGFGFLVPLIAVLSFVVATRLTPNASLGGGLALLTSAVLLWPIGARLNREIKKGHTLFWIPMQYWAVVLGVYGVLILFGNR